MKSVRTKTVIIWVLVCVTLVAFLSVISNGFAEEDVQKWGKVRNPNNLLDYTMPQSEIINKGLIFSINEDGVISLKGNVEPQYSSNGNLKYIQWAYTLTKVYFPAGKYTLSCEGGIDRQIVVSGQYQKDGKNVDWNGYGSTSTVIFTEPTQVTFFIRILRPGYYDVKLYPIVNKGANPIDYYVYK